MRKFFSSTYLMMSAYWWHERLHDQMRKEKANKRCHHQASIPSHQKVMEQNA